MKVLTEKEAQVELQASEITASEERMRHLQTQLQLQASASEERMRHLQTQLQQTEVEF